MIVGAFLLLLGISVAVVVWRRKCPFLLVGWLWYVGMLVPVIGLVQVGRQAHADRYTYLSQIGLYIALAWGVSEVMRRWPHRRWACGAVSAIVLMLLAADAWQQTSYWRNNEALWVRALACTSRNGIAHDNLAQALALRGDFDGAIEQFHKALAINPNDVSAHNNLGNVLLAHRQIGAARVEYQQALQIQPDYVEARGNLGNVLIGLGRFDEAIAQYREVLKLKSDDAVAYNNLGSALLHQGQIDDAIAQYQRALEINPEYMEATLTLATRFSVGDRAAKPLPSTERLWRSDPTTLRSVDTLLGFRRPLPTPVCATEFKP